MADKKLVKSAGEHWVCSVLSRLGWAVALTRDGVARTDILGEHSMTRRMIAVQVKAASFGPRLKFFLTGKDCAPAGSDREWYVLVGLAEEAWASPRAFIVPRDHVAAGTWISHMHWQTDPSVPAGTRTSGIDKGRIDDWVFARYEKRWDLLNQPASMVPVMLPPRFRQLALGDRVGLPADHPWHNNMPAWDLAEAGASWPDWARAA